MSQSRKNTQTKNIILFIGIPNIRGQLMEMKKNGEGKKYRYAVMHNIQNPSKSQREMLDIFDIELKVHFDKPRSMLDALRPYENDLKAVTCRSEFNIRYFQKVIPYVPYLRTPTVESLDWSTDKIKMRRRFLAYDKSITPLFKVVTDATTKTVKEIEDRLKFPVVIKPAGLALSLLVTIAYHPEELQSSLARVFRKITKVNRDNKKESAEPRVLVEQFMEGTMYSVDAFVSSRGHVSFCPMVYVKTGRDVGFDDFFSYLTLTPTNLTKKSIEDAQYTATQAIHALGLRSTSAHIEMLKTEHGWKIIEVGPRLGGFRHTMYELSFGINITLNDIFTRIPKRPVLYKKIKGYTAVLKFFPKKEGVLTKMIGIKRAQTVESFHSIRVKNKLGERAYYAKHGGKSVFEVTLFNKDRSRLLADIRRLEKMVHIDTESTITRANIKRAEKKDKRNASKALASTSQKKAQVSKKTSSAKKSVSKKSTRTSSSKTSKKG